MKSKEIGPRGAHVHAHPLPPIPSALNSLEVGPSRIR